MTFNDLRVGWRTLLAEPAYSLVVIGGLALGLAACLLLLGFVRYSWLYNTHVPDVERVYVIKMQRNIVADSPWFDQANFYLRAVAARDPGVEAATGYLPTRPKHTSARIGNELRYLDSLTVLPGFADIMGVRTVRGNLEAALERPEGLAITDAAALRLFGSADAIGRELKMEGQLMRVLAVVSAPPNNTTVPFESLVGVNSALVEAQLRDEMLTGQRGWWGKLLVRVKPGASLDALQAALQRAVDEGNGVARLDPDLKARLGKRKPSEIALAPLRYAYFDRQIAMHFMFAAGERANPAVVAALGAVAVLVLLLAAINYVNLATVRVLRRQREIALRKVLGGGARQIALQFLAESLLVAVAATALGIALAWLVEPLFARLVARPLDSVLSMANLAIALVLGALVGMASAIYPAWIALRVPLAQALSGRPDSESMGGMRIRRVMTVLQVAVGMGLAAVTMAVGWQTAYAMRASPGFDPAGLVVVDLPEPIDYDPAQKVRSVRAALAAQPEIAGVAASDDAIGRKQAMWMGTLRRPGQPTISLRVKPVSANFFEMYGLKPVAGRLFAASLDQHPGAEAIIVNAIAARQLGFADPQAAIGQRVDQGGTGGPDTPRRIVGIAPEVRYGSLHDMPGPITYNLDEASMVLTVRAASSKVADAERAIARVWQAQFPEAILHMSRASDVVTANYDDDARMARLLAIATGIAMAIAAFGTYALAAHTVQRRGKEIVLRKLYGAGGADIGRLVTREIAALAGIAALIAMPVGALVIGHYLAGYVEHAEPAAYWALLLALGCALAVAAVAVARHAVVAMRMRPAAVFRG